jgi:hypothetical protein
MAMIVIFAIAQAALSAPLLATPDELVSAFDRFCVQTHAEPELFDAKINRASDWIKASSPSLFAKIEFNRRWKKNGVELALLDAPPPTRRSCSVVGYVDGSSDEASLPRAVAKIKEAVELSLIEKDSQGYERWAGSTSDGSKLIVNVRSAARDKDVEIILVPQPE